MSDANDMTFKNIEQKLAGRMHTWLVTGAAGFIGSHLVKTLLGLGQRVVGLDNFATGFRHNIEEVERLAGPARWRDFRFVEGDITDPATCTRTLAGVDYVLHQAALGSVPRSIQHPLATNAANVTGFLNVLDASRLAGVKRVVFASSSSVYGDDPTIPKVEDKIGKPLSPYALSKLTDENYAAVFGRVYNFKSVGLRYFNVFGPHQNPAGAYAAVIPRWIDALRRGKPVEIYGDGETSRDFCYVDNAVAANLCAALAPAGAADQIYNVAVGRTTSLNQLFAMIRQAMIDLGETRARDVAPTYAPFRPGDIRNSLADVSKAARLLGYAPVCEIKEGVDKTVRWFLAR
jgi:UDP-N-acetylglucosamine 4-epimerase